MLEKVIFELFLLLSCVLSLIACEEATMYRFYETKSTDDTSKCRKQTIVVKQHGENPSFAQADFDTIKKITAEIVQGEMLSLQKQFETKLSELESKMPQESCSTSSTQGRLYLYSGIEVFCDGGWTVFQKRNVSNGLDFNQNWNMYKSGFGNLDGDFWLGLDNIHALTRSRTCRLRVDVWDSSNNHGYAIYSNFNIADEGDKYRLLVSGYSGIAGDRLTDNSNINVYHNNMQFTTKDNDNDRDNDANCASYGGGWWFNSCLNSCLTCSSLYWKGVQKQSTMKFRCD